MIDPDQIKSYVLNEGESRENPSVRSYYYIRKFIVFEQGLATFTWNWPAFFFSYIWFGYRKMYGYAALLFFLEVIAIFLFPLYIIAMIFRGGLANYVYYRHIKKRIVCGIDRKGTSIIAAVLLSILSILDYLFFKLLTHLIG